MGKILKIHNRQMKIKPKVGVDQGLFIFIYFVLILVNNEVKITENKTKLSG